MFYTIYDKHDNFLVQGNSVQCARYLDMNLDTFYCTVCRCLKGTNKKYKIYKWDKE